MFRDVRPLKQKPAKRFRRTPNLSKFEITSAIIWQIGPTITAPNIQPNGPGCELKRPCCWICFPLLIILKKCCSHSWVIERNKCRSLNQCELVLWFFSKHIFSSLSSRACRWIFFRYEMIEFKTKQVEATWLTTIYGENVQRCPYGWSEKKGQKKLPNTKPVKLRNYVCHY